MRVNDQIFTRDVFIQQHSTKDSTNEKPAEKTVFVINVPPYIHESELKFAFGHIGKIESVIVAENVFARNEDNERPPVVQSDSTHFRNGKTINKFKVAYIIFKLAKSLRKALETTELQLYDAKNESVLCTGIKKWEQEYDNNVVNEKELEAEVNQYMEAFEHQEQEHREEDKKVEVDEDGWTTVKRGKVGGGFEQKESILKALEEKIEKGRKKKEFTNFYTFQIRESKQKHIMSLRKKFEKDKMKVEALKKARRFKPF